MFTLSRFSRRIILTISVSLVAAVCVGAAPENSPAPTGGQAKLDAAKDWVDYQDSAHGFSLSLPPGVKRGAGDTDDRKIFSGFTLPPGTNLRQKKLIIFSGSDPILKGTEPMAPFTSHGVVFQRAKVYDGSAGHMTLHIIYTWKNGDAELHFDFTHYAANVLAFDPPERPREYSEAEQIKFTEKVMGTFKPLAKN